MILIRNFIIIIIMLTLLNACDLYRAPKTPHITTPKSFKTKINLSKNTKLNANWWENFHDKKLNYLIKLALKNNYDYQIAIKNISIASTYVSQNQSALFPQISLNLSSSRNKSSPAFINDNASPFSATASNANSISNLQQLSGSVSYEIDVWNQIRNSVNQAKSDLKVSEENSKIIKLSLIANITDVYFQILILKQNLANLTLQYQLGQEVVALSKAQFHSGLMDGSTLDNAYNQVDAIKLNIASIKKQIEILRYTLAYLVGDFPEDFDLSSDQSRKTIAISSFIPGQIPATIVANRPDVQAAFHQVMSYGYLEKQNIANFLPSINLTGNYGYANSALSSLVNSANSFWSYGLFATQIAFDYQSRWSLYQRSKYQYEAAILNYKNVLLNAFKETENALISYQKDREAWMASHHQWQTTRDLSDLSRAQYQSGLTDYSTYITTRLNYLQADFNYNNQKLLVIEDAIQVYKSFGLVV